MMILGINAYHGDASAAAFVNGRLVAATEEERFTRIKHAAGFPQGALAWVAEEAGLDSNSPIILAVARDPRARLARKVLYGLRSPRLAARRAWVHEKFSDVDRQSAETLGIPMDRVEVRRVEHHTAHLASSFFCSPFDEAALLSIDGMGDFASAMWGVGQGNRIRRDGAITFPHSLGIFYTALTQYLGFLNYGDEYKVMGLASYGEPEFLAEFRRILRGLSNGVPGFSLDLQYFRHHRESVDMTWGEGKPLIGRLYTDLLERHLGPARNPTASVEQRHQNVAASMQQRLEEVLLDSLRALRKSTGLRRLCLAGGVAFNCVANGKICAETGFDEVYVQSAAGDAGLAIGAALYVWHRHMDQPRSFTMDHSYWGPEFNDRQIRDTIVARREEIERQACTVRTIEDQEELCRWVAERIAAGQVIGWFQGRMEWGPRALGNRSILADPRRAEMRDILNSKVKRREMFRPFAPSIAEEATGEYFEQTHPSPFMNMAYRVRPEKRDVIPATTHVDGTGRLQTVNEQQNPLYYRLIKEFERRTGVPVLLNTSFNENEPIVRTPEEALDCFLRTRMDALVCGSHVIERTAWM
jgi:carbamoyltransferase